jgi:hypothetical protein
MGLLHALGLGKDPHVLWMIEAFGAKPGGIVVDRLYQERPSYQVWQGEAHGAAITFYTEARNRYLGGAGVYLGKAGPQFVNGISEYRCYFYRPTIPPTLSMDDSRWAEVVRKAMGDPEWTSTFPEEAFELGVGVGRFAMELDCPLDARPLFSQLDTLRGLLGSMSDAVARVYLYAAGVGVGFTAERLTKEKLLADVKMGSDILRVAAAVG